MVGANLWGRTCRGEPVCSPRADTHGAQATYGRSALLLAGWTLDDGEELSGHHRAGHCRAGDPQPRDLLRPLRRQVRIIGGYRPRDDPAAVAQSIAGRVPLQPAEPGVAYPDRLRVFDGDRAPVSTAARTDGAVDGETDQGRILHASIDCAFCKGEAFAHNRLIFAAGRNANASPQRQDDRVKKAQSVAARGIYFYRP